jgi:hypothetical protein
MKYAGKNPPQLSLNKSANLPISDLIVQLRLNSAAGAPVIDHFAGVSGTNSGANLQSLREGNHSYMMHTVVDQKPGNNLGPANRPMPTLESPKHCRAYAGFLMADHLPEKAAAYYRKAADIYIDQGQVLRALAVSLAMWQTVPPQPEDVRHFSEALRKDGADAAPLVQFLSQLDEEVLAALIPHMQAEILDASHTLIKPGQIHNHLYINVSGTLRDAIYLSVEDVQKTSRSPTVEILENEFFGEIYPFEKEAASQSYIETLSPVEVIKISKESL